MATALAFLFFGTLLVAAIRSMAKIQCGQWLEAREAKQSALEAERVRKARLDAFRVRSCRPDGD